MAVDQAVGQRREDSRKTELKCAKARRAKIYSEPVGYGANSDGYNMVARVGGKQCMNIVMDEAGGDFLELGAVKSGKCLNILIAESMNILTERKDGEFMRFFLQISVEFKLEAI